MWRRTAVRKLRLSSYKKGVYNPLNVVSYLNGQFACFVCFFSQINSNLTFLTTRQQDAVTGRYGRWIL